jgi:hypothetical protein
VCLRFITIIIATVLPLMATACGGTAPSPDSEALVQINEAGATVSARDVRHPGIASPDY